MESVPGRREQISTRIVFFIAGFGMAAWAPLVPYAKMRAQLDDGALGLLLLCLGAGSIVAMPLTGILAARRGCRFTIVLSSLLGMAALPFLAVCSSFPGLATALLAFGAGIGSLDVAMNIQAVMVERASGKTMMSGFHGLFSVGSIAGSVSLIFALGAGVQPLGAIAGVAAIMLISLMVAIPALLPYGSKSDGPIFAIPHGVVLFFGILCAILFLTEGSVLDWSAVALITLHGMDAAHAGLGYAAFAVTMTIGRLAGDFFVHRFGPARIVILGGLCAAFGVALSMLAPTWPLAVLGYALVGAGCSNIVPVLFSATGRQKTMPESAAIPAISLLGYAGILVGPAIIGFIAHLSSLTAAFLLLAGLLLGVAVSGRFTRW